MNLLAGSSELGVAMVAAALPVAELVSRSFLALHSSQACVQRQL